MLAGLATRALRSSLPALVVFGLLLMPAGVTAHATPRRCADADTPASNASAQQMRAAVVCLINRQRVRRHLPPLSVSPMLNHSAQGWTDQMVASGDFSHGPGDAFAQRISAAGYDWQIAGENIATGFPTPHSVVSAWMGSTEHCRNILNPEFRDIGTGVDPHPVRDASNGPATWTQDFGLLQEQAPPSQNDRPMDGCPYR